MTIEVFKALLQIMLKKSEVDMLKHAVSHKREHALSYAEVIHEDDRKAYDRCKTRSVLLEELLAEID